MKKYTKPEMDIVKYQTEEIMVTASTAGTGIISGKTISYNDINF